MRAIGACERNWYTRHLRELISNGLPSGNPQLWSYEVEILYPGQQFRIPDEVEEELTAWCKQNCQHYWARGSNRLWWFESEEDAMLFNIAFAR